MKKIGIIGGIGPESTVEYYRGIIDTFRQVKEHKLPEIILYSASVYELLELVDKKKWKELIDYLLRMITSLKLAGAEFALISANTPHIVFDEVLEKSPLPLLSIVEETFKATKLLKIKKIGLIGTKFTMGSSFYAKTFSKDDIQVVVPNADEQAYIHNKLMTEIELGIIKDETRDGLLSIIKRMKDDQNIEGIILGCTEFSLILKQNAFGIPFLNTTAIHIESIVNYCLES
ncbi:MAG: amino acid racemase [Flavobacteriaceae bacterium]|nr:amino acid racemase [Flavobacteriaceae bacterium]